MGAFEWRGLRGETRALFLKDVRPAAQRLLVQFSGVHSREDASALTNGVLWADASRLPIPGPASPTRSSWWACRWWTPRASRSDAWPT